uniref:Uncharacterized protein n=1 Tax=Anopheles atroparvus TaxID=41427 RepID=A0AAG5DLA1_ANOAO
KGLRKFKRSKQRRTTNHHKLQEATRAGRKIEHVGKWNGKASKGGTVFYTVTVSESDDNSTESDEHEQEKNVGERKKRPRAREREKENESERMSGYVMHEISCYVITVGKMHRNPQRLPFLAAPVRRNKNGIRSADD